MAILERLRAKERIIALREYFYFSPTSFPLKENTVRVGTPDTTIGMTHEYRLAHRRHTEFSQQRVG